MAEKYQQGIRAANAASVQLQPDLDRQSTFDQLNRFVFRRNGPGTEGGSALVTAAGGGAATVLPTAADTTTAAAGNSSGSGGDNIAPMGIIAPPNRPPSAKAVEWWGRQSNGAQMVPPASAP